MKLYAIAFLGGLSLMLALPAHAEWAPSIVVSEINWGGSGLSTADEWFELANVSQETIDVSGWTVSGVLTGGEMLTLPAPTLIEPGATILVSNYDLGNTKSTLLIAPSIVTTAVSLPNDKLMISLIDTQGTTVDSIDALGSQIIGSASPHVSMERDLVTLEWLAATTSANLGEINQFGTPGIIILSKPIESPPALSIIGEVATSSEGVAPTKSDASNEIDFYVPEGTPPVEEEVDPDAEPEATEDDPAPNKTPVVAETPAVDPIPAPTEVDPVANPEASDLLNDAVRMSDEALADDVLPPSFPAEAVIINAFMSAPNDGNEWIELENPGAEDINLTDWTVHDESGKETLLTGNIIAGEFAIIDNPKGKLNNDGDAIVLVDPAGNVIDELEYGTEDLPAPEKGEIGSRENQINLSNTELYEPLLPNAAATSTATTAPVSGSTDDDLPMASANATSDVKSSPIPSITGGVTQKKATSKQSSITTIEGVVTALPGTFAKQYFYVNGTQVYLNSGEFPEFELGDHIQVTGTQSETKGEPRIKIKFGTDIVVLESSEEESRPIDTQDVVDAEIGELVTLQGHVVSRTDSALTLKDENGEANVVVVKKTNISLADIGPVEANVTGIVRLKSGDKKIFPRSQSDIEILNDEQTAVGPSTMPSTSSSSAIPIAAGAGAGATSLGGVLAWIIKSRRIALSDLLS